MKSWFLLLIGVGVVAYWVMGRLRHRALAHDAAVIARLIQSPRQMFHGTDEALRERTAVRRKAAEGIRGRAAKVDSGSPVGDVLRMVKKG